MNHRPPTALETLAALTPPLMTGNPRYWLLNGPARSGGDAYDLALRPHWLIVWASKLGLAADLLQRAREDSEAEGKRVRIIELAAGDDYDGPSSREAACDAVRGVISRHVFIDALNRITPAGKGEGVPSNAESARAAVAADLVPVPGPVERRKPGRPKGSTTPRVLRPQRRPGSKKPPPAPRKVSREQQRAATREHFRTFAEAEAAE